MNMFSQIAAVTGMNLKAIRGRLDSALVIVLGMAIVVGVTAAILSLSVGVERSEDVLNRPNEVYVYSENARFEGQSSISREKVLKILDAPGIRKYADGTPAAIADTTTNVFFRLKANNRERGFMLRGTSPRVFEFRPDHRITEGRMFTPGLRELVVGRAAANAFQNLEMGAEVRLADGPWTVVGIYATDGGPSEWYGYGDADTLMTSIRRPNFNSVTALVEGETGLQQLREALDADPTLDVRVWPGEEYWANYLGPQISIYQGIAYGVGFIMALGTLAAALSIMYAAVSARAVEIATLRAIGFGPGAVATSVVVEAMLLAGTGALIGASTAWALFNGRMFSPSGASGFLLRLDVSVALTAALIAVLVGGLAGLFPAIRAARLPVVMALQAR
jgi:putative ABC transport system permease protein